MSSEFDLIKRFFTKPTDHTNLGIGDDAALINIPAGYELVVSTDMLVAGRHFFPDADPYQLGHKCLAVNLSDIAAMGATPRWVTLALALPEANEEWLKYFSEGFFELASKHQVDLIGGDTNRGPLNICVQVMGVSPERRALRRDGAKVGDQIWVSGQIGNAALGLAHLLKKIDLNKEETELALAALHTPIPRIELGLALSEFAHSAIDISDGLLADLGHILECSQVGAELNFTALPKSPMLEKYIATDLGKKCLLAGGDDYELCFTAPVEKQTEVKAIAKALDIPLTCIGKITRSGGISLLDPLGHPMPISQTGFDHFGL